MTTQNYTLPDNISLEQVIKIVKQGGQIAEEIRDSNCLDIQEKSVQDRVTHADLAVERHLREHLSALNPNIGFMGEEFGVTGIEGNDHPDLLWIADPIDGTENFCRGIDHWSISVALVERGTPVLGVVYVPSFNSIYAAEIDKGAFKNDMPLKVSNVKNATQSLIAMGVSARVDFKTHYLDVLERLNQQQIEYRRFGSAAYSLCQVAEGIVEGYLEIHLMPWDGAAGMLIAREAGALTSSFDCSKPDGSLACAVTPGIKEWFNDYLAD